MAITVPTFPTEYLEAIDEVLTGATYAGKYNVGGAEFVNGRIVSVPEVVFGNNSQPAAYSRFKSEASATIQRTPYELDHDVEKVFYLDALDSIDEAAAQMTTVVSEYQRTIFAPYIDKDFFDKAAKAAGTTSTATVTAANIKAEFRKMRDAYTEAGLTGGEVYMSSAALAALEDATDRQWSNETSVTDTIGSYDGFTLYQVPVATLGTGVNMLGISGGTRTVRYVTKRAASYAFAPGQHTQGDGWLSQFRWVFGTIVHKNKKPGIFVSKTA